MKTETAEYYHLDPDDGLTLNLGINPLLQFGLKETREQLCMNILNDLSAEYFTFELNDEIIRIHQPEETWHSGRHSSLLYYPIEKLTANYRNIFNVYMRVSGGLAMVETGDCLAGIMGQSMGAGSAENTASWFMNPAAQASADFIVDDGGVVQYNPDIENSYCWHCGGSKYGNKGGSLYGIVKNANSIGIEICSTNSTGRVTGVNDRNWSYTEVVLANAFELVKYLMEKYGIDADHVIRHYDVNGKPCPGIIGWNEETGDVSEWRAFKAKLILSAVSGGIQCV